MFVQRRGMHLDHPVAEAGFRVHPPSQRLLTKALSAPEGHRRPSIRGIVAHRAIIIVVIRIVSVKTAHVAPSRHGCDDSTIDCTRTTTMRGCLWLRLAVPVCMVCMVRTTMVDDSQLRCNFRRQHQTACQNRIHSEGTWRHHVCDFNDIEARWNASPPEQEPRRSGPQSCGCDGRFLDRARIGWSILVPWPSKKMIRKTCVSRFPRLASQTPTRTKWCSIMQVKQKIVVELQRVYHTCTRT
mmetsp:Transcript_15181/g.41980  ORF Transcript_15181/g.41980 Transcript_15181/m.41980 type:complete len:241 (-) Transcript_15181:2-724(-)